MTDAVHSLDGLLGTVGPDYTEGYHEATEEWGRHESSGDTPDDALRAVGRFLQRFQENLHEDVIMVRSLDMQEGVAGRRDAAIALEESEAHPQEYILQGLRSEELEYLAEALEELESLEAGDDEEEDLPLPAPGAAETARQILWQVIWGNPRRFGVSSLEDGAVILGADGGPGHLLSIFCDANGAVSVFRVRPGGGTDEKHCPPHEDPPIGYIREALRSLPPGE